MALPSQRELERYTLSPIQWLVLEDFESFLEVRLVFAFGPLSYIYCTEQVPLEIQRHISSEPLPRLGSTVQCFELLRSAWNILGTRNPRVKPWTDIGLQWADTYYKRMDNTRTYAITMCKSFLVA